MSEELVEVGDGDEPDAETTPVEVEPLGAPVDPPDSHRTLYGTILSARDHERRPIVPAWLRNHQQRVQAAKWAAGYTWYVVRFHAWKSPKYAAKTALWAPWGVFRTVGRVLAWAWAEEGNWALRQHAANRGDADSWLRLDNARRRSSVWRWWVVGVSTVAAAVAAALLSALAPAWVLWVLAAATVPVLAWAGRPADRPITDRVSTGPKFVKLTAEMVRNALCSIGVPNLREPSDVTFAQEIHRDGPGWLARVNLKQGVEAVKVLEARGRLSSALRLPVDQVWPEPGPEHAGQVDLWVGYAPASKMGQPKWSLAKPTARTSVFAPAEFGTDQRQRPVKTQLFARNFLIGGVPGSGKSYGARTLAIIAALDPAAELKIVEYKGTGDFTDLAPLCTTYACGVDDEAFATGMDMLAWGLAEAERRGKRIRAAKLRGEAPEGKVTPELAAKPGSGLHPVVMVIDEAHELFGDGTVGKEAAVAAERLIKRGRALGLIVVLATQIPDKDSLPSNITRCVTVRWCMAVQDQVANDMILGTGAYKRGLTATVYRPGSPPDGDAGWGIVTGIAKPGSVCSHFPDPKTAAAIVARATQLRGGRIVGDGTDLPSRRDVLDDARRVYHAGEAFISWPALAEALREQMPEAYADMTPEAVSALLRDKGVPSEDGRCKRTGNRVLKGAKVAAVDAAIGRRELETGGSR